MHNLQPLVISILGPLKRLHSAPRTEPKASLTPRLTNDDKQRLKWNSFKSPLKKIKKTTLNKSFSWSRRYGCRPTAILYLIQSVVVNGNIIQSDSLFDIFKMSLRSCQCELIFVHVWNVLQDVVLPSLGNNLLEYNGSAMQHLLEGCKYYPHPPNDERMRTENRPCKLADFH